MGASVPTGVLSRISYEISGHTSRNQIIILSDEILSVITWAGSAGSNTGVDGARGDVYSCTSGRARNWTQH